MRYVLLVSILSCPDICSLLGYDLSIKLSPRSCYCADFVDTRNPSLIPNFDLHYPKKKTENADE